MCDAGQQSFDVVFFGKAGENMKNFDLFTTENGIAGLTLDQIPYSKKAYISIRSASNIWNFLEECKDFCLMAGAQMIYVSGHEDLINYPHHTDVVKMVADPSSLTGAQACLFPVTEGTTQTWREIYNERMKNVPNSSLLDIKNMESLQSACSLYFVHENGEMIGIGAITDDCIKALASTVKGAGKKVLLTLCSAMTCSNITLEVATANQKAVKLYEDAGFIKTELLSRWFVLYEKDQT